MLLAVAHFANDDAGQPVLTLQPNEVVFQRDHVEDQPAWSMSFDVLPVPDCRITRRGRRDFEVFRAVIIRQNNQLITTMLDRVFVADLAGRHQNRVAMRVIRVQNPHF